MISKIILQSLIGGLFGASIMAITTPSSVIAGGCESIEAPEFTELSRISDVSGFRLLKLESTTITTDNPSFTPRQTRYYFTAPKTGIYKISATKKIALNPFGGDGDYTESNNVYTVRLRKGETVAIQVYLSTCDRTFRISIWE